MESTDARDQDQQKKKTEKMKMSDCFITAMFLPKEYGKLLKLKAGKFISYFVLLLLLVSVIQYAIPAAAAIAGMGGIENIILNEIPDFALKDGSFSFDERIEKKDEDMGVYILVDTDEEKFTKEDIPEGMAEAIMVSRNNLLVYNNVTGLGGIMQEDTFENYKSLTLTNQTVADGAVWIYMILFFVFAGIYAALFVRYFFVGLFYAVVMYLLAKTMMMELTFGKVYKIALFAQSVGAVVMAVMYCIGSALFILTGSAFNMLITVVIMNKALIQMKLENEAL